MRFARKDAVPHPRDERSREDGYKREVSVQAVVARQRVPLVLRDATGADRKILKRRDFVLGLFHVGRHRRWAADGDAAREPPSDDKSKVRQDLSH